MNFLIVDEASQIEIGNLNDNIHWFQTTPWGRCVSLVMTNNVCSDITLFVLLIIIYQCHPHGKEYVKDLQSIFELHHLEHHPFFWIFNVGLLHISFMQNFLISHAFRSACPQPLAHSSLILFYEDKLQSSQPHPPSRIPFPCKFINAVGKENSSYEVCSSSLCSPLLTIIKNHAECTAVIRAAFELQKT